MTTMDGHREFHDELTEWLEGVKAAQGGLMALRHVAVPDDADRVTIEAAITALNVRKAKAVIPSTAAEMQADIDLLTDRWSALSATA